MWKILVGFIAFAALALWILSQAGDKIDLGGESHGVVAHEAGASQAAAEASMAASSAASAAATAAAAVVDATASAASQ